MEYFITILIQSADNLIILVSLPYLRWGNRSTETKSVSYGFTGSRGGVIFNLNMPNPVTGLVEAR